jgi:hypothetical protein
MTQRSMLVTLVLAAACGGGGGEADPDAPPAGGPDAAPDAVPTGSVQVTTHVYCCDVPVHTPAADVIVHLLDPDHRHVLTTQTGADGTATLDGVIAGSAVVVHYLPTAGHGHVVTAILDVAPGDSLAFGDGFFRLPDQTDEGGHYTVTYPPIEHDGMYVFQPFGWASQLGPSPASGYVDFDCTSPSATLPIIAYGVDNAGIVGSAVLRDVNLAPGESYTVDAWSPAVPITVTASAPDEQDEVQLSVYWNYPGVSFGAGDYAPNEGGQASRVFPSPVGVDSYRARSRIFRNGFGEVERTQSFAASATTLAIATTELPWMGQAITSFAEQRVRWIQDGEGGDAVVARLAYRHGDEDYAWTIVGPAGGETELSWADFPADVPAPRGDDEENNATLFTIDLGGVDTYAQARSTPEWLLTCPSCLGEGESGGYSQAAGGPNVAERALAPQQVARARR